MQQHMSLTHLVDSDEAADSILAQLHGDDVGPHGADERLDIAAGAARHVRHAEKVHQGLATGRSGVGRLEDCCL